MNLSLFFSISFSLSSQLGLYNTPTASLQRGKTPTSKRVLDMTLSNLMVILELWGIRSTPSLPLLPGSLWPRMVAPNRVLPTGLIEPNCMRMLN